MIGIGTDTLLLAKSAQQLADSVKDDAGQG